MRHRKKKKILDRKDQPRKMMLKNLASSVIIYEKVKTTEAKARTVKPIVEKIIALACQNNLTARRRLIEMLSQKMAVKKAMEVLGERYRERKGGYSRIIKLGKRQGDGAKIVQIELV